MAQDGVVEKQIGGAHWCWWSAVGNLSLNGILIVGGALFSSHPTPPRDATADPKRADIS